MKKVFLSSLLACAASVAGLTFPSVAQTAPAAAPAGGQGAAQCPPLADAEYKAYDDATKQTQPQGKAAALEAYLTAFPNSCVKTPTLQILLATYLQAGDAAKMLDTADRILQIEPNNLQALYAEATLRRTSADAIADPAGKQAALDKAADAGQKGLNAPKPAGMSDDDYAKLKAGSTPVFYGAIGAAALNKKDGTAAADAFKKELASVPVAQTQVPGSILQDTYFLALSYMQANPPDYLSCAFYGAGFVALAPEPYKTHYASTP